MAPFFFQSQEMNPFGCLGVVGGIRELSANPFQTFFRGWYVAVDLDVEVCHSIEPLDDVSGRLIGELNHGFQLLQRHVQPLVGLGVEHRQVLSSL